MAEEEFGIERVKSIRGVIVLAPALALLVVKKDQEASRNHLQMRFQCYTLTLILKDATPACPDSTASDSHSQTQRRTPSQP